MKPSSHGIMPSLLSWSENGIGWRKMRETENGNEEWSEGILKSISLVCIYTAFSASWCPLFPRTKQLHASSSNSVSAFLPFLNSVSCPNTLQIRLWNLSSLQFAFRDHSKSSAQSLLPSYHFPFLSACFFPSYFNQFCLFIPASVLLVLDFCN